MDRPVGRGDNSGGGRGPLARGEPVEARELEGVDLKTAQRRLGHSTPMLTLGVYAQATETADRAAAETLGEHWIGARDGRAMEPEAGSADGA
jgi:hypothetical protein